MMPHVIQEILDLSREYEAQLNTDPVFHARVTGVANVLVELQKIGRLDPQNDSGFAAFIVMAALEKEFPSSPAQLNARDFQPDDVVQYVHSGTIGLVLEVFPDNVLVSYFKGAGSYYWRLNDIKLIHRKEK